MITRSSVRQLEVLVGKLPAVDGLSSGSIVVGEISTLKARALVWWYGIRMAENWERDDKNLPGTWSEGSPCGRWSPCSQSRALLCRAPGSSLQETLWTLWFLFWQRGFHQILRKYRTRLKCHMSRSEGNERNEFLSDDTTEKGNGKAYCELLVLTFRFLQCVTIEFYHFYL